MVIDLKHCIIEIRDGSSNKISVKVGNGNLTYTEKRNMDYIKDRGLLNTVREGDEEPMDVRLDIQWEHITATGGTGDITTPSIEDALKQKGGASAWVSSSTDACEPYCVDIYIFDIPVCANTPETLVLPDFRWESLAHDIKASTIAVTGRCNAKQATATRGSAST